MSRRLLSILTELKVAADAQLAFYQRLGVADADLGPFEAFGKALAADPATGFTAKYGALSGAEFISAIDRSVYGRAPGSDAAINLQARIDYVTVLP